MASWFYWGNPTRREYLSCPLCLKKHCCLISPDYCHALLLAQAMSNEWLNSYVCLYEDNDYLPWDEKDSGWKDITMQVMRYLPAINDAHKEIIKKEQDRYHQEMELEYNRRNSI